MAKRNGGKRNSGKPRLPLRADGPGEDRVTEFLTVAWMLSVFTTLVCELSAVAATWYLRSNPEAVSITALASTLIFAALVIGLLSLVLMAIVWKMRRVRPPSGISVFSLVVGAAPGLLLILRKML